MSKNVIDQKSIHVKDTLFEEILNGFSKIKIKEKQDKKDTKLNSVQKQRLVKVGQEFLKNEQTIFFTKEWVGRLCINEQAETILKSIIYHVEDSDDENEENEENEEEDKKIFNVFSIIKAYRLYKTMENLYNAYKAYNKIKDSFQDWKKINLEIEDKKLMDSNLKIIKQVELVQKMYEELLKPIVVIGGKSLVSYIENNTYIDMLFDKLDESVNETIGKMVLSLSVNAILHFLPHTAAPAWLTTGAKLAWYGFNWSNLIYNGVVFYNVYRDIFDGVDDDEIAKISQFIDKNITQPFLKPQYVKLEKKINNFLNGIDDALDVAEYVKDKATDFKEDFKKIKNKKQSLDKGKRRNTIQKVSPGVSLEVQYNVDTKAYEFSPRLKELGNSIISSMFYSHSRRYNVLLDDESFKGLFDSKKGLLVLRVLDELKNGIYPIVGDFYANFYSFIDKVGEGLIELIKKHSLKVKDKVDSKSNKLTYQDGETDDEFNTSEYKKNFGRTQDMSLQTSFKVAPKKQLRLSERSLQPIHPIFANYAMVGLELELLDAKDNQISIKIPNWNNTGAGIEMAKESRLGTVNNYLKFHADYDIIKDEYFQLLEEEKSFNDNVQKILDEIILTIDKYHEELE